MGIETRMRATIAVAAMAGALGFAGAASAAEITVLTSQGCLSGVRDLAAGFEQATGNKVNVSFEAGNALNREDQCQCAGRSCVANTSRRSMISMKRGKVVAGSVVEFARAGNGVAVKAGSLKRDISTPEAFKMAMLNSASRSGIPMPAPARSTPSCSRSSASTIR